MAAIFPLSSLIGTDFLSSTVVPFTTGIAIEGVKSPNLVAVDALPDSVPVTEPTRLPLNVAPSYPICALAELTKILIA